MNAQHPIVLLPSSDARLAAAILSAVPDAKVAAINGAVVAGQAAGKYVPGTPRARVWAFVDWVMPECSGLEMCRRIRSSAETRDAHITMVLEPGADEARRRALDAGADDYVIGPLGVETILQRLGAASHENGHQAEAGKRLRSGELSVDLAAFQARFKGRPLPLRPTEFRLLAHFMENPDRVQSREALIETLGKDAGGIDVRTVDVWVGRLRRGLRAGGVPDPLRTVRSLGYVMDSADR